MTGDQAKAQIASLLSGKLEAMGLEYPDVSKTREEYIPNYLAQAVLLQMIERSGVKVSDGVMSSARKYAALSPKAG
jgi:hypothetical protein